MVTDDRRSIAELQESWREMNQPRGNATRAGVQAAILLNATKDLLAIAAAAHEWAEAQAGDDYKTQDAANQRLFDLVRSKVIP